MYSKFLHFFTTPTWGILHIGIGLHMSHIETHAGPPALQDTSTPVLISHPYTKKQTVLSGQPHLTQIGGILRRAFRNRGSNENFSIWGVRVNITDPDTTYTPKFDAGLSTHVFQVQLTSCHFL